MRFFLLALFFPIIAFGHPHCFIEVYPGLKKQTLQLEWSFDEMSSQMLMMDFDKNMDGEISHNENYFIEKEAFNNLEKFEYYAFFYANDKKIPTKRHTSFEASIKENKIHYIFTLDIPADATSVKFYDEEMFTSFIVKAEFVKKANPNQELKLIEHSESEYFIIYELELP